MPLLQLLVVHLTFSNFFGESVEHCITYPFTGNLLFNYYREATTGGMNVLLSSVHIFMKVSVPKYMFLLSKNILALINFDCSQVAFFLLAAIDGGYLPLQLPDDSPSRSLPQVRELCNKILRLDHSGRWYSRVSEAVLRRLRGTPAD